LYRLKDKPSAIGQFVTNSASLEPIARSGLTGQLLQKVLPRTRSILLHWTHLPVGAVYGSIGLLQAMTYPLFLIVISVMVKQIPLQI
jgi:hypothetical protein